MGSWEQYGIVLVAILIGGGFAFGGIASYAGLTPDGGDQQEFNTTLPSDNFREGPMNLNVREVSALARYYDVAFVNVYYETEQQRQELQELSQVSESFGDRAYVSLINSSEGGDIMIQYGVTEYPTAVVLGAGGASTVQDPEVSSVTSAICDSFRSLQDASAVCL